MKHKENIPMQKAKGLISVVSTGSLCIVFADVIISGFLPDGSQAQTGSITFSAFLADRTFFIKNF